MMIVTFALDSYWPGEYVVFSSPPLHFLARVCSHNLMCDTITDAAKCQYIVLGFEPMVTPGLANEASSFQWYSVARYEQSVAAVNGLPWLWLSAVLQQSLFAVVSPLLVSTLEINYDLFWHNWSPLCGAGQIVALGMFRHESSSTIAGVSDTFALSHFAMLFSQEMCSSKNMLWSKLTFIFNRH